MKTLIPFLPKEYVLEDSGHLHYNSVLMSVFVVQLSCKTLLSNLFMESIGNIVAGNRTKWNKNTCVSTESVAEHTPPSEISRMHISIVKISPYI